MFITFSFQTAISKSLVLAIGCREMLASLPSLCSVLSPCITVEGMETHRCFAKFLSMQRVVGWIEWQGMTRRTFPRPNGLSAPLLKCRSDTSLEVGQRL